MKRIKWLALALSVLMTTVQAASFDCSKAASTIEKAICRNDKLSKLDEELNTFYRTAMQNANQKNSVRQSQKQWIKQRNSCKEVECVTNAYEVRLEVLKSDIKAHETSEAQVEIVEGQRYSFQLTRGAGVLVCEAYLTRLNSSQYEIPPACTRPEPDNTLGFTKLNRVYISSEEAHSIVPRIRDYYGSKHQGSKEADEAEEAKRKANGLGPKRERLSTINSMIEKKQIVAWRYNPAVDIDNDGIPDNVLMWQGYGLLGSLDVCGEPMVYTHFTFDGVLDTAAFVVAITNDRLDTDRTMAIFGHPSGGFRFANGLVESHFRPIGHTMGIFKYQGLYYFDTLFDWRGDFQNLRQNKVELGNTLGVFLRRNDQTKQICEYQMTDNESADSTDN